jgi:tyrosinase
MRANNVHVTSTFCWGLLLTAAVIAGPPGLSRASAQIATVEIQINRTGDPRAAYVGWGPTFCRARVVNPPHGTSDLEVTLQNASSNTTGRVLFAAMQTPWPANTTASAQTLPLMLPGDGSWKEFIIAGDWGHASVRDRDTAVTANTPQGEVGRQALMVRVRKDARKLTLEERDRFLEAVRKLHLRDGNYEVYVQIHNLAALPNRSEGHGGSAFLPWHRAFILHLERALQAIDPSVTVPYWKFDEAAPEIFNENFMGADSATGFAAFTSGHPFELWSIEGLSGIYRGLQTPDHTVVPDLQSVGAGEPIRSQNDTLLPTDYAGATAFSALEGNPHGYAHVWAGLNDGWIRQVPIAPRDPLFFLLHCNVDRLWALWQQQHDRFGTDGANAADYAPVGVYPGPGATSRISHYLGETMWPWNGKVGANQAFPNDPNASRPAAAPGGPFPVFTVFPLGPPAMPQPAHLIDYLGRKVPAAGIGVSFDDVPYSSSGGVLGGALGPPANGFQLFADKSRPLDERLRAARTLKVATPAQARDLLRIAADKNTPGRIRIQALTIGGQLPDEQVVKDVTALARDKDNPAELRRRAAFRLSFQLNFAPLGHAQPATYIDTLRALLDDPDQSVRDIAVSTLVAHNDTTVLRRLVEGLKDPAKEIQPAARALHSLATARHGDYYEVFKSYYEHARDPATRIEAARGVAKSTEGHEELRKTLLDTTADPPLRLAILRALSANATDDFLPVAFAVVEDSKNSPALRTLGLSALAQQVERASKRNTTLKPELAKVTTRIRELAARAPTADLRAQAWQYLRRNDPHFLDLAPGLLTQEKDDVLKMRLQGMLIDEQRDAINKLKAPKP